MPKYCEITKALANVRSELVCVKNIPVEIVISVTKPMDEFMKHGLPKKHKEISLTTEDKHTYETIEDTEGIKGIKLLADIRNTINNLPETQKSEIMKLKQLQRFLDSYRSLMDKAKGPTEQPTASQGFKR